MRGDDRRNARLLGQLSRHAEVLASATDHTVVPPIPCLGYTREPMAINSRNLESIVRDFTASLVAAVEAQTSQRIRNIVSSVLGGPLGTSAASAPRRTGASKTEARLPSPSRKLSDRTLAVSRLQGLGALRGLPPAARARMKTVAHREGVAAALGLAKSLGWRRGPGHDRI